jgi:hypothetical protein
VTRTNNAWSVQMAGAVQATNPTPESVSMGFQALTNGLATGPFHFEITRSVLGGGNDEPPPRAGTVPAKGASATETARHFLLEGVMR